MIRVIVYFNQDCQLAGKRLFERQIDWDDSIHFPIDETVKVLKTLFGSKSIVILEFD